MIDTILHYSALTRVATFAQILTEIKPLGLAYDDGAGNNVLDKSRCVVIDLLTQVSTDLLPRAALSGITIWCATDATVAASLWALPNNVGRLQVDRSNKSILQNRIAAQIAAGLKIEPVFAGTSYSFG